MDPHPNREDWKAYRIQHEVTVQLDEKISPTKSYKNNKLHWIQGTLQQTLEDDPFDFSDDDAEGKPNCNKWKGHNYHLHVLGSFPNEFEKRVKGFQVPPTASIALDPFCRSELCTDDPPTGEAYLIWKGKDLFRKSNPNQVKGQDFISKSSTQSQNWASDKFLALEELELSTSGSKDESWDTGDDSSDTDQEISLYIQSKRRDKKKGMSVTGETLWYDNDNELIRNLHSQSVSLTSYELPADERHFGNTRILFDQLLPEEKLMLRAVKSISDESQASCMGSKGKDGNDKNLSLAGGGDY